MINTEKADIESFLLTLPTLDIKTKEETIEVITKYLTRILKEYKESPTPDTIEIWRDTLADMSEDPTCELLAKFMAKYA